MKRQETNVRLPICAVEALRRIVARRGVSRDEVLRQILGEHVAEQEARLPDDRLTHISTLLRYPATPHRSRPRLGQPVRLRLEPGMTERARAVSLLLPGQSLRAHRDYQARLLTDAVMTAIAVREPFTDVFLDGLLPLLRHGAAVGFWRLVVAVSSTPAELAVWGGAETIRAGFGPGRALTPSEKRLLLVDEALAEESWHAPERFVVATNLARKGLGGQGADEVEQMLYEQGKEWEKQHRFLRKRPKAPWFVGVVGTDWSGRGGTAVWRAERRVALGGFEDWLLSSQGKDESRSHVMWPPGWTAEMPVGWEVFVLPRNEELPVRVREWVDAGRVMLVQVPPRNKQVVWPCRPGLASPAPGAEPLVALARNLRPDQVLQLIEAVLVRWGADGAGDYGSPPEEFQLPPLDAEFDDLTPQEEEELWASIFGVEADPNSDDDRSVLLPWPGLEEGVDLHEEDSPPVASTPHLLVPVDQAYRLGFVTADERRVAMAAAREYTLELPDGLFGNQPRVARPVHTNDARFRLLLTRRRTRQTAKPMFVWPETSVAAEIEKGGSPEVISLLATWALWTAKRELQGSMEQAWHAAFDHHPASYWHQVPRLGEAAAESV